MAGVLRLAGLVSLGTGPLVAAGSLAAVTGLVQRAGIGLSLLWMTAVSIKLHVLARAERAPDQGATSPGGRRRRRAR
jgi:hypothetical protein